MIPFEPDQRFRRNLTSRRSASDAGCFLLTSGSGFGQWIFGGRPSFPHGLSLHFDLVGVVNEPVEDRVGEGPIADHLVPVFDRELARDQRGAVDVAVVHDLEQIAALIVVQGGQPPVVDLCGAPHKSTNGETSVMCSPACR